MVGACSLIVPEFSLADDLLPGEILLQQHHFGPGGVVNRRLIRISRGRLIVSGDLVSSVEAEELARAEVDVGGAGVLEASLGATAAGRALAGSHSNSTRFGSGGPVSGPLFTYQWCMAPWGSGGEGLGGDNVALQPESLPLVPMRASLIPTLATGGPTRVVGEGFSDPAGSSVVAGRVTRSGRCLTSPPPSFDAAGSASSPGFRGSIPSSRSSSAREDEEERSPYDPWRFQPDQRRVYSVGPEGRSSHPLGYPIERDPCSVLDHVLSVSLRGLDVAELRERGHDACEVFVFRARPGGEM